MFIRIENFYSSKDTIKNKPETQKKKLKAYIWLKILVHRTYEELSKLNNKLKNKILNWVKDLNKHFTKEDI